mgnify:CR=1 FL=1
MEPRMLKGDDDYEAALAVVEQLVGQDPQPGTADGDKLELFAFLVEEYEKRHFDLGLPDPVAAIKFRMEQQGLRQRDLVPYFGSRSKVSEVLRGKRPLTLAMIRALHAGLGIPADVLLQQPGAVLPEEPELDWRRLPLGEMSKRDWLGAVRDVRDRAEELATGFLSQLGSTETVTALCRQTSTVRSAKEMDRYSLLAWCVRVLSLASKKKLEAEFRKDSLTEEFLQEVARLSWSERGPLLAVEFLENHGIAVVVEPHLPKTHLDGAALLGANGKPVIGLTIRHDRIDNFWFTLLHELGHVQKHLTNVGESFVDDLDFQGSSDKREREADESATNALIPPGTRWKTTRAYRQKSASAIRELAAKLRVHPAIIAGRIRHDVNNYRILTRLVGVGQVRGLFEEVTWPRKKS